MTTRLLPPLDEELLLDADEEPLLDADEELLLDKEELLTDEETLLDTDEGPMLGKPLLKDEGLHDVLDAGAAPAWHEWTGSPTLPDPALASASFPAASKASA